jgi:hypothetical protein
VAELHDVLHAARQRRQEPVEPLVVRLEAGRQLPQHGTELSTEPQRHVEELLDPGAAVEQELHVRQVTAALHGEDEARRRRLPPPIHRVGARQAVEGGVQLHRLEEGQVALEPAPLRQLLGIEHTPPVTVLIPAGADVQAPHGTKMRSVRVLRCRPSTCRGSP